jgi:hypothetical protein
VGGNSIYSSSEKLICFTRAEAAWLNFGFLQEFLELLEPTINDFGSNSRDVGWFPVTTIGISGAFYNSETSANRSEGFAPFPEI